ncbi:MAG: sigma 54-interacting transcriptional regulator [Candidatus Accumulibacter sp.]|jgi:transcriptional regulator with PAS, ATPase and Fis domain|nr:sigma 54-interacting transcriptional regulator [Accumulibacter sp.]
MKTPSRPETEAPFPSREVLSLWTGICDDLANGRHDHVRERELLLLAKDGGTPRAFAHLIEAFGIMLVKQEARSMLRNWLVTELQKKNRELEETRELLNRRYQHLNQVVLEAYHPRRILGQSPSMRRISDLAIQIAHRPINTMILGATGTGKEVVAKVIHYNSPRREREFIAVNCSAIPESLFESEMFGIEKGVATGVGQRQGLLEAANGGTLFLDELADMSFSSQSKLLRVLQDGELRRVGGVKTIKVDLLVISATSQDIGKAIAEKRFRADLYYRLNVAEIDMPPLCERGDDILILSRHFLNLHAQRLGRPALYLSSSAQRALLAYAWPGNVRELSNEMERLAALTIGTEIVEADISARIRAASMASPPKEMPIPPTLAAPSARSESLGETLPPSPAHSLPPGEEGGIDPKDQGVGAIAKVERLAIVKALAQSNGNKTRAAEILGISREGLRKKLKKMEISDQRTGGRGQRTEDRR